MSLFIFSIYHWYLLHQSGPENLKTSRPKNSWNDMNQFHRIFKFQIEKKLFYTRTSDFKCNLFQHHAPICLNLIVTSKKPP